MFWSAANFWQNYWLGLTNYSAQFMEFMSEAGKLFITEEQKGFLAEGLGPDRMADQLMLNRISLSLFMEAWRSGLAAVNDFNLQLFREGNEAFWNTINGNGEENLMEFWTRQNMIMNLLVHEYPEAIKGIQAKYGLHFERSGYSKTGETERFELWQILPNDPGVEVNKNIKPILIIPPYVLGPNILAFLPEEKKSFVHCFANQGIPTYIRIVKNIEENEAVQKLTPEEDCLDTRIFLNKITKIHGRPATLCGYCQGGFTAAINYLSGKLDRLVDALIVCVAPMDGTLSKGLSDYVTLLPERYRALGYATYDLPNGNPVVSGKSMSLLYKLKAIGAENPVSVFFRDYKMFARRPKIGSTAAAINYWLTYDITPLPVEIVKLSLASYRIPIGQDGTLPVKLFGKKLNFKKIRKAGLPLLICIAEKDDLVEKDCALAPLKWVDAEVTIFPKGHVAMATSWSLPTSECSLAGCFLEGQRGPVKFHLDHS